MRGTAADDERRLEAALRNGRFPLQPPRSGGAPRRYEYFVLQTVITALAGLHPAWQPRYPPPPEDFLRKPYFRLGLPAGGGELIWQPIYPNLRQPGFPIRALTHDMRPDMVVETPEGLLVVEAKYRFFRKAVIGMLDALHAYRDGLVDAEGREVVVAGVAATPRYEPHEALYYEAEAFEESGIGLVHLPVPGEEATPRTLTLRQVLERYLPPA